MGFLVLISTTNNNWIRMKKERSVGRGRWRERKKRREEKGNVRDQREKGERDVL